MKKTTQEYILTHKSTVKELRELRKHIKRILKDYKKTVTITNKSKIEADFHTFTKNKISIFKPIPKHGILQPNDKMDIEIVCCADDAIKG